MQNLYERAKSWRNPLLSLYVHGMVWLMCYRTTLFVLLCIGGAIYHTARRVDLSKGELPACACSPIRCM